MFCFASLNDVTIAIVFFPMVLENRGNIVFVHRFVPLGTCFPNDYVYNTDNIWVIPGETLINVLLYINSCVCILMYDRKNKTYTWNPWLDRHYCLGLN